MSGHPGEPDEIVLEQLRKACDGRVRPAGAADAIAGAPCRYVATPASTAETAEVVRVAAEHDLRIVARGRGTKQGWGMPPSAADLVVETTAMSGVVEHAAGDLISIAGAGIGLEDLQATLASAGQHLALDDPFTSPPASATLGGVIATDTSGPGRVLHGTARDLVIGITFVRADGVVAKAGGKVVKNVAGYDFGKLLTGSFGTLGIITEVTVRLHPLPRARRLVTVSPGDSTGDGTGDGTGAAQAAAQAATAVLGSQVVPTAVEVDQAPDGSTTVAVLLEGVPAGLDRRAADTAQLLGADSAVTDSAPAWFGRSPFGPDDVGLKITTTMTGTASVLTAARRLTGAHGVALHVRGSAAGVLYAGLPGDTDTGAVAALVHDLRKVAATHSGAVVVLTAPRQVREAVDVWGPVPGLDLMRRLKDQLDPAHRLAPGRFVGGI